jgi:hypothetical protein
LVGPNISLNIFLSNIISFCIPRFTNVRYSGPV